MSLRRPSCSHPATAAWLHLDRYRTHLAWDLSSERPSDLPLKPFHLLATLTARTPDGTPFNGVIEQWFAPGRMRMETRSTDAPGRTVVSGSVLQESDPDASGNTSMNHDVRLRWHAFSTMVWD